MIFVTWRLKGINDEKEMIQFLDHHPMYISFSQIVYVYLTVGK